MSPFVAILHQYILLGVINSATLLPYYTHVPSISRYMYRVNVYKRVSVHASVYLLRSGIGYLFAGGLTSQYTAGTRRAPGHVLFYDLSVPRARSRYRSFTRLSYSISVNARISSYRKRDIHQIIKVISRVFRSLRLEVLGHLV